MTSPLPWPARLADVVPVYAGDDFAIRLTFRDGTNPIDVTPWGAWSAQARPSVESDALLVFTVDTSQATTGIIVLNAAAALSEKLRDGGTRTWFFDAQTTASGVVTTRVRGSLGVEQDVTR